MPNRIAHTAETRSVNRDERTIDVIASTAALDSYGTKIDPNGWDLEQFRKNPVITWAHDDRGFTASGGRPIARGENIRVEDGKLKMRLRFPDAGKFVFADEVFNLLADGFLNAVSVGFEAIEYRDEKTETDGNVRVFTKQRLMELAVVTIPSNDEALVERQSQRVNANPVEVRMRLEHVEKLANEVTHSPEDVEKWRTYFTNKQPANKEATGVLKRFYTLVLKCDPPADEVDAWKRMAEEVEKLVEPTPEPKSEPVKTEEVTPAAEEPKAEEPKPEEPKPEPKVEVKEETPPPPTPVVPEAPARARKASVQIPLSELPALLRGVSAACAEAAVKASRQGVPIRELGDVIDAAAKECGRVLIPSHP